MPIQKLSAALIVLVLLTQSFTPALVAAEVSPSMRQSAMSQILQFKALLKSDERHFLDELKQMQNKTIQMVRPQLVHLWQSGKDEKVEEAFKKIPAANLRKIDEALIANGVSNPSRLTAIEKLLNVYSEQTGVTTLRQVRAEIAASGGYQHFKAKILPTIESTLNSLDFSRDDDLNLCGILVAFPFLNIAFFFIFLTLLPIYLLAVLQACIFG